MWEAFSPKIFNAPWGTCFRPPKMGQTSSITMPPSLVGLGLRTLPGSKNCDVFLFFCLSCFWKDRDCEHHITMKELELRNKSGTVG